MSKKTSFIFFGLVGYIVLQFLWWEVLLVKQSNEIITEKQHLAALSSSDEKIITRDIKELQYKKKMRVYMIVGEGTVFLFILLIGIQQVRKSIKRETALSNQQKNFILSVSHELKTPIAASKLQLQTLLKHDLDREQQKILLNNALSETERLHKLVNNVLLITEIENNTGVVHKEKINLSELVEDILIRYFSQYIQNKAIRLHIEKTIFCNGDKNLIPSLIINLVENAIKYSFESISINIFLKKTETHCVLEIQDNGCGIIDEEKEKAFDKFYRSGNEDVRKTKGTGMGLYIVKQICNLHEAKIAILNNVPKGSIFRVLFKPLS